MASRCFQSTSCDSAFWRRIVLVGRSWNGNSQKSRKTKCQEHHRSRIWYEKNFHPPKPRIFRVTAFISGCQQFEHPHCINNNVFIYCSTTPAFHQNVVRIQKLLVVEELVKDLKLTNSDAIGKFVFPATQSAPAFSSSFIGKDPSVSLFGNEKNIPCLIIGGIDQVFLTNNYWRLNCLNIFHSAIPRIH